ncbi:winged helix-turn-helix domain-containing protein [Acetobacter indonesiensis]|uniref:winged helix-turn-helix domain-containing protein n=1 Tax=Acetobacter indonesiensis TaxID=104101 RepID=UPI0015C50E2A|nr:winged helix-turn-helix domain-containing protein [Acetobacter indonesiensis]
MSKRRWSKFWWQDYERDPALRLCSLAAQGLWMRLLCLMHEAEPYGHLCVNNQPLHPRQLALMLGVSERQINRLMAELRNAGVYSTTPQGSIYSRRLLRDKAASDQGAAWGRTGGNPNLKTGAAAPPSAAGVQSGVRSGTQSGSLSGSPSGSLSGRPSGGLFGSPSDGGSPPHNQPGQGGTIQPAITPAPKHQEAEAEAETHSSLTPFGPNQDVRQVLFKNGLDFLQTATGRPERSTRALMGKWLKMLHDDAASLLALLSDCAAFKPAEPVSWLESQVRKLVADRAAPIIASLTASASLTPPGMADQMPHPATISRRAQAHTAWQNVPDMEGV